MDYNILLSHGIDPQECSHLDYIDNDKEILIFAKIKQSQRECIYCHFKDTKIKDYKQKTIKSLHTSVNSTIITLDLPRYHCPSCNDHFHYMEYLTNAVQSIRRRVLLDTSLYFQDKSWMNTHWRLLTTNQKNYTSKMMTLKSGMTISYYDRVYEFVKQDTELQYTFFESSRYIL